MLSLEPSEKGLKYHHQSHLLLLSMRTLWCRQLLCEEPITSHNGAQHLLHKRVRCCDAALIAAPIRLAMRLLRANQFVMLNKASLLQQLQVTYPAVISRSFCLNIIN